MSEISKSKKQNQRGAGSAMVEPASESPEYPGEDAARQAAHAQSGVQTPAFVSQVGTRGDTQAAKTIGEPPGSPSYYGQSHQQQQGSQNVGRYGTSGMSGGMPRVAPIGDPPGSRTYFGQSGASEHSSPYAPARMGVPSASRNVIGQPPGSADYFGRSGTAQTERVNNPYGQASFVQRTGDSRSAIGPAMFHGTQSSMGSLATVGLPAGTAAYLGTGNRRSPRRT